MTFVCIVWNIILNVNINKNNCYDIIYSYDYLSMIMFIMNSTMLLSIFLGFIIFVIIHQVKNQVKKRKSSKNNEDILLP